ncbi:hypothetical protein EDB19DRAFT_1732143 [Suillus lakei]|nr:hypothetical protein EDB19DRAFT_1732143 [Suillus lakei]
MCASISLAPFSSLLCAHPHLCVARRFLSTHPPPGPIFYSSVFWSVFVSPGLYTLSDGSRSEVIAVVLQILFLSSTHLSTR